MRKSTPGCGHAFWTHDEIVAETAVRNHQGEWAPEIPISGALHERLLHSK
jgi:hypothetical protein